MLLAVPVGHAETQLLFAKQDAQGGDGRLPLRDIPAASRNVENIARNERAVMLMSVSSPSSTISSRGKSTVRQFRRWAVGAGKIDLAQRQRAVNEAGEKVADVVIHDNPLPIANRGNSNVENRCPQAIIAG